MRSPVAPVALGAVLALVAVVVLLAPPLVGPGRGGQAEALAGELRCPDCQALSVAESRTAAAAAIRAEIAEQLAAGRTPDEVRRHFVERYGEWILLRPASPVAWLLPLAVVGVAGLLLAVRLLRRAAAPAAVPVSLDAETRRRLADESEALDA